MNKETKSYICPKCHKKQITVLEWRTCSFVSELNLSTNDCKELDIEKGDFENFTCPSCSETLPASMNEEIMTLAGIFK